MEINQRDQYWVICIGSFIIVGLLLEACSSPPKPYTIGIISYVSVHAPVIEGFKAGMTSLGYREGEDIIYIDNGPVEPTPQDVDAEIKKLLEQNIDLLFSVGNLATLRAKHAAEGTTIPIVFGAIAHPIEERFVESISHPGGKLTGTQTSGQGPKALEWLVTILPDARKVYVPYNPRDEASVIQLNGLDKAPLQLGIELVFDEIASVEEAVAAIENLPDDIDAIFRIPSPTLDPRNAELSQTAITRRLPMSASLPLDKAVLLTLAVDFFEAGKQTARLAHQIRQGEKPADLPVETAEIFLTINLKTAEEIGLDIPDEILLQADTIIRQ